MTWQPETTGDADHAEDVLRGALAATACQVEPTPTPVGNIVRAGRARRARRRAALAVGGAAAALCLGMSLVRLHGGPAVPSAPERVSSSPAPSSPTTATPSAVAVVVGEGRVDGQAWKVTLTYYPTFPKGFTPPPQTPPPGWPKNLPWHPHTGHSLICLNVSLGGQSLSGGPLDSCDIVNGPYDLNDGGQGALWGTHDKGTTGTHLLIVRLTNTTGPTTTHAVATYRNGHHLTVPAIPLPGTEDRAYAIPVPAANPLATVDEYDAHNHLTSHTTQWR